MIRKYKLGELLDVKRGMSLPGEYYSESGKYVRLTLGNFDYPNGGFKTNTSKKDIYYTGEVKPEFILHAGDIITPLTEQTYGLLGETAKIPEDDKYIQSGDVGLILPNKNLLDNNFAYYLISSSSVKKQLSAGAQQTKIRHTSPEKIKDCIVYIPELAEQKKIGYFLSKIDQKIELNKAITQNLADMANVVYSYFFYNKPNNGILGDIIVENVKSSIQVGEAKKSSGKIPFFTSGDSIYRWNDIIVSGRNCYLNTGGNADIKFYVGEASYSTDTWCITGSNNMSDYLYLVLLSIKHELNMKYFQGTGLRHLQKPLLKGREIYIPNNNELTHFNNVIKPLFNKISENLRENWELVKCRDWLMPKLLNGQIIIHL